MDIAMKPNTPQPDKGQLCELLKRRREDLLYSSILHPQRLAKDLPSIRDIEARIRDLEEQQ